MRLIVALIDLLGFERFEETFHWRIVVAVSFSTHARQAFVLAEPILEEQTGELRTAIAMDDQAFFGLSRATA